MFMDGESIRQARLQKLKSKKEARLKKAFSVYSRLVNYASKINIVDSKSSQFRQYIFDDDLILFRKMHKFIIALESLVYFTLPIKEGEETKQEWSLIGCELSNGARYHAMIDCYFPYHLKHPSITNLSIWDMSTWSSSNWEQCLVNINALKQALYGPSQCKKANNFTSPVHKTYRLLKYYIKSLYAYYPELCAVETSITSPIKLDEASSQQGITSFNHSQAIYDEKHLHKISAYETIRKSYKQLLAIIDEYAGLGVRLVGYFWKLRHSALTGYFYQVFLFFDNAYPAKYLLSSKEFTKKMGDSLHLTPFKLLSRDTLNELLGGLELMDSYLKLTPRDPNKNQYYKDRLFGKAQFKPNKKEQYFSNKQQDWQVL